MCSLALCPAHKQYLLSRHAFVFFLALAQHQLAEEGLGKPVVTQATEMPHRGKITTWQASNTIAVGYEASIGFLLFTIQGTKQTLSTIDSTFTQHI